MNWRDKVVVITGASSGIGRELALQLGRKGAKLGLLARREDLLQQLTAELQAAGFPAAYALCDVRDRDALGRALGTLTTALGSATGGVDVFIANAGVAAPMRVDRFDAAATERLFAVNVQGAVNGVGAVLPDMLKRGVGHIVGIASIAAYGIVPENHPYSASKAALLKLFSGLGMELRHRGVTVTVICPGFIRTDMTAGLKLPMPFMMDCDVAVGKMIRAIERRARVYNFPRRLYWLARMANLIPAPLIELIYRTVAARPKRVQ